MALPWMLYSAPLLDAGLDPTAFMVASAIYAECREPKGSCFSSSYALALRVNLSRNTVLAALQRLLRAKMIRVVRVGEGQCYRVNPPTVWVSSPLRGREDPSPSPLRGVQNLDPITMGRSASGEDHTTEDPAHYVGSKNWTPLNERKRERDARVIPACTGSGPEGPARTTKPGDRQTDRQHDQWAMPLDPEAAAQATAARAQLADLMATLSGPDPASHTTRAPRRAAPVTSEPFDDAAREARVAELQRQAAELRARAPASPSGAPVLSLVPPEPMESAS